MVQSKDKRPD
jgi:hypothetical protein